ncbi:hypothetical protein AB1L30_00510, partial [Bremerella sp. JC817]|uniref:hypothetical protein n=1 Tax=Bremerella sp. JC817 TaxID=3231756 RepID=UPI003457CDF5
WFSGTRCWIVPATALGEDVEVDRDRAVGFVVGYGALELAFTDAISLGIEAPVRRKLPLLRQPLRLLHCWRRCSKWFRRKPNPLVRVSEIFRFQPTRIESFMDLTGANQRGTF